MPCSPSTPSPSPEPTPANLIRPTDAALRSRPIPVAPSTSPFHLQPLELQRQQSTSPTTLPAALNRFLSLALEREHQARRQSRSRPPVSISAGRRLDQVSRSR